MTKTKTSIKLLRHLGFVLIALPDPITTPFGVASVLMSRYLARSLNASLNKRLRETLREYLAHFKRFNDNADSEYDALGRVRHYTQSAERLIPWQYKYSRSFEANAFPLVWYRWRDTRDNVIHHTVNMKSLSRRYGKDSRSDTSNSTAKVIHHTINMELLYRRYGNGSARAGSNLAGIYGKAEGVTHHSVSPRLFSQRHKAKMSGTRCY